MKALKLLLVILLLATLFFLSSPVGAQSYGERLPIENIYLSPWGSANFSFPATNVDRAILLLNKKNKLAMDCFSAQFNRKILPDATKKFFYARAELEHQVIEKNRIGLNGFVYNSPFSITNRLGWGIGPVVKIPSQGMAIRYFIGQDEFGRSQKKIIFSLERILWKK